jgi:hypothetical protein
MATTGDKKQPVHSSKLTGLRFMQKASEKRKLEEAVESQKQQAQQEEQVSALPVQLPPTASLFWVCLPHALGHHYMSTWGAVGVTQ